MTSIQLRVLSIAAQNGRGYKANMLHRSLSVHGTDRAIKTTETSYFKPNLIRIMQNRLAVASVVTCPSAGQVMCECTVVKFNWKWTQRLIFFRQFKPKEFISCPLILTITLFDFLAYWFLLFSYLCRFVFRFPVYLSWIQPSVQDENVAMYLQSPVSRWEKRNILSALFNEVGNC